MKTKQILHWLGVSAVTSLLPMAAAHAEDWQFRLGAGGALAPDYEGSSDYQPLPLVTAEVKKGDYYIKTRGLGLEANVIPSAQFNLGPVLQFNAGRDSVDNQKVDDVGNVPATAEAGLFANYTFPRIFSATDSISVGADVAVDVLDGHGGFTGTLKTSYTLVSRKRRVLSLSISTTYADKSYMDSFFSVSTPGSQRSGLATYTASSGIKDAGIGLTGIFPLNKKWALTGLIKYKHLLGDAADSPLVDTEGSVHQIFGGLGISYAF